MENTTVLTVNVSDVCDCFLHVKKLLIFSIRPPYVQVPYAWSRKVGVVLEITAPRVATSAPFVS